MHKICLIRGLSKSHHRNFSDRQCQCGFGINFSTTIAGIYEKRKLKFYFMTFLLLNDEDKNLSDRFRSS